MPNLKPFQFFGSRLFLCLLAITMAWPLMFWMVITLVGAAFEPTPIEMASGIGASIWDASNSLLMTLSRISAQPAVFISVTLSPSFL
jgi:hypothetical protein